MSKKKRSKKKPKVEVVSEYDVFGEFEFIAGYTENGVPFGILREEDEEEMEFETRRKQSKTEIESELPF